MTKKIGLYGGTFNPIHFGHLNLAIEMLEKHSLDQIWFCPARVSPFKNGDQLISAEHRLKMLELSLKDIPQFTIIEDELHRQGPSYTIDTVEVLLDKERKRPDPSQLYLILGDDSLKGFEKWHRVKELIKLIPLLVGQRNLLEESDENFEDPEIREAVIQGLTTTKIFEISSTEVRDRLRKGLYCGHLIPEKVLDYIKAHRLYL